MENKFFTRIFKRATWSIIIIDDYVGNVREYYEIYLFLQMNRVILEIRNSTKLSVKFARINDNTLRVNIHEQNMFQYNSRL